MKVEKLTEEKAQVVRRWWVERGEGSLPEDVLPPDGWVADDEDGAAVAAWVYYPEGVRLAIMDWLVSRPGLTPKVAREAGRAVFSAIVDEAKARGVRRIFATVCRDGMLREVQACGFQTVAGDATHLIKTI